jgi:hypothetical protein
MSRTLSRTWPAGESDSFEKPSDLVGDTGFEPGTSSVSAQPNLRVAPVRAIGFVLRSPPWFGRDRPDWLPAWLSRCQRGEIRTLADVGPAPCMIGTAELPGYFTS